ncbi:MAG: fatty acid desaturase [Acidimicrobiia bacterium]|nr:fatty acid desaturase [Acidimicrobiia bacterium]
MTSTTITPDERGSAVEQADGTRPTGGDAAQPERGRGDAKGSLRPVIDVIPESAYERPTWKGLAYFFRDVVVYGAIVAGLVLTDNPLFLVPLWILAALAISALFIVGHDAAHGALFKSRRMNGIIGRIAMLPSWHVYEGWVLGHNRVHHKFTACQGFDFVWHPVTPEEYEAMSPLARLRHRIEWSWFGAGAYYVREIWLNKMVVGKPPKRFVSPIRRDRILVGVVALGVAAVLAWAGWAAYGSVLGALWMVAKVWVIPFLGFSFVIGSVVHVHHVAPDIRWWPRKQWSKFAGQVEATTILHAPKGLDFFFHWIMVHIPHHVDVRIPMYNLPKAGEAIVAAFPEATEDKLRFRDFVRNTRQCKLYDFDEGRWYTYAEAAGRAEREPAPEPAAA